MRFQRPAIIAALALVMAAAITGGTLFLSGGGEPCAPSTPGAPATGKMAFVNCASVRFSSKMKYSAAPDLPTATDKGSNEPLGVRNRLNRLYSAQSRALVIA